MKLSYLVSLFIIFVLLFSYPLLPTIRHEQMKSRKGSPLSSISLCLKAILNSRIFLRYLPYFFFFQLSFEWMNSFNIYYFKYSLNQEYFFSIYAFTILAQMFGASIYPKLCRYINEVTLFYLATSFSIFGMLAIYVLGRLDPSNLLWMFVAACVKQIGSGLFMVATTADLAHSIQFSQEKTGLDNVAILTSVKLLVAKLSNAIAGLGVGMGLSYAGFVSNQIQSPETAMIIGRSALIIPVFIVLMSCFFYQRFVVYKSEVN
ncbi:melibiose:sodium symporter [Streptococcus varani]|uniref:Melibiose:sodium symporter n=1 Tax=Streptococcus varani TaxID=1608583 RepID=A0A0E3WFC6_9STRE|nr:melibiose:sodium symporter [Streptococcus varani]